MGRREVFTDEEVISMMTQRFTSSSVLLNQLQKGKEKTKQKLKTEKLRAQDSMHSEPTTYSRPLSKVKLHGWHIGMRNNSLPQRLCSLIFLASSPNIRSRKSVSTQQYTFLTELT